MLLLASSSLGRPVLGAEYPSVVLSSEATLSPEDPIATASSSLVEWIVADTQEGRMPQQEMDPDGLRMK
jgi:hypothetical protein